MSTRREQSLRYGKSFAQCAKWYTVIALIASIVATYSLFMTFSVVWVGVLFTVLSLWFLVTSIDFVLFHTV